MKNGIVIPEANLQNIEVFDDEPGDEIVAEIKRYAAAKGRVHDWRWNSHTPPPENAHVEYIDEVRLAAKAEGHAIAPCPCCSPFSPKFKKGLIAWFPDERVIRIIGGTCFRNLDEAVEKKKRADLHRRQTERSDRQTIRFYASGLDAIISTVAASMPIFEDIDSLLVDIRASLVALRLPLDRHVRNGELWVTDAGANSGGRGKRTMSRFGTITGAEMVYGTHSTAESLRKTLQGLRWMQNVLGATDIRDLDDETRTHLAARLPAARQQVGGIFNAYRRRQSFVSGETLSRLSEWSKHPGVPLDFAISRDGRWLNLSVPDRGGLPEMRRTLIIGKRAEEVIPDLPAVDAQAEDRESA